MVWRAHLCGWLAVAHLIPSLAGVVIVVAMALDPTAPAWEALDRKAKRVVAWMKWWDRQAKGE